MVIYFHEDVLKYLQQRKVLFWRELITPGLKIYSIFRKGNIEIVLFTTQSQWYSITKKGYATSGVKTQITDITAMNICISNTAVEFGPLEKTLQRRNIIDTRSSIVNSPYKFLFSDLDTSMQSHNTRSSPYTDNNNLYQGLIKNPDLKEYESKKVSAYSYWETICSITNCN